MTGTEVDPAAVVAELKTMPQILSTQTEGVPVWVVGLLLLVAQGMVIQSVEHVVPTLLPSAGEPPVMLKDMAGVFTRKKEVCLEFMFNSFSLLGIGVIPVSEQAVY